VIAMGGQGAALGEVGLAAVKAILAG
jgi:hypothetical protein